MTRIINYLAEEEQREQAKREHQKLGRLAKPASNERIKKMSDKH